MNIEQFIAYRNDEQFVVFVDAEDYERVTQFTWRVSTKGYVMRSFERGVMTGLHNFVMNVSANSGVDHIDRNKLNNTKQNLRLTTNQIQGQNRNLFKNNTSGYTGVTFNKSKQVWIAQIKVNYKQTHIGQFATKEQAAFAYNEAALKFFGPMAKLNNIEGGLE